MLESPSIKALVHLLIAGTSLLLVYWSELNPRVLLYGYVIALIYSVITVWFIATWLHQNSLSQLLLGFTRRPTKFDNGNPFASKKKEPQKWLLWNYIGFILNTFFLLGLTLFMWQGDGFLEPRLLVPELAWASLFALYLWCDELFGGSVIIDPQESPHINLDYNTPQIGFVTAAVFFSGFLVMIPAGIISAQSNVVVSAELHWITWTQLILLVCIKLGFQLKIDFRKDGTSSTGNKGFRSLSKYDKRV